VRGTDHKIWLLTLDSDSWSGRPLGGVTGASPATVTRGRSDGRADVVITMDEEYTAGDYYPSTWWKKHPN
jgi:hypothetical protein